MKISLKGKNFTPGDHSQPLCRTCVNARYRQGGRASQSFFFCGALMGRDAGAFARIEAFECSDYYDKRIPPEYDFEERAFILTPTKNGEFKFLPSIEERRRQQQIRNYEKNTNPIGVVVEDEELIEDEDLEEGDGG